MGWMYFPECSVVAIMHEFEDGTIVQSAPVGSEGVVPVRALLGSELVRSRHIVPVPGFAMRIKTSMLLGVVENSPLCRRIVATHLEAFLSSLLQSVACNAVHSVEERCARWLLMFAHSTGSRSFSLTHDSLAELLGVHRPTVTVAMCALREARLIRCGRGKTEIIDQRGLEQVSCGCHRDIRQAADEQLPGSTLV
jgi:Crp-like helix-turn-helix domain